MKKLLLLPVLASIISLLSFKEDLGKSREYIPEYYVTSSKPDSTLKKDESLFVFNFSDGNGEVMSQEIKLSYNGIQKNILCNKSGRASIVVKPGKYVFQFFLNKQNLEIKTDSINIKPGYQSEMEVNFQSSVTPVICDKPVIYVYPTQSQNVSINLDLKGQLGFTYPAYQNGWNFVADADGTIHMNDKKYHYLFWDGKTEIANDKINWDEGFVVSKDSLVPFFETKLAQMGLNSNEIEDYITYWCPRMNVNENNYVHFLFNEQYNEYATLNVNPKPDHLFRVFMLWSKADASMQPTPQAISSFQREGFTVVEWGGAEMNQLPLKNSVQVKN
jgi:hypothetical protein